MSFLAGDELDDSVVVVPKKEAAPDIESLEGLHFLARKGRLKGRLWAPIRKCAAELLSSASDPPTLNAARKLLENADAKTANPFSGINLSLLRTISEKSANNK